MEFFPEWAPNLHPLLVHFPIAFILGAIGADVLSFLVPRWDWLHPSTVLFYVVAGASAVLTYITGTWAADSLSIAGEAQSVLTQHANLGWWTMWFFGVYGLMRLGIHFWPGTRGRPGLHGLLLLVAFGGVYFVYQTGERGAEMVYRYGVGVDVQEPETVAVEPGLARGESGWNWSPRSDTAWTSQVTWLDGQPSDVRASLDTTGTGAVALRLRPKRSIAFVLPDTLGAVQVTAELNLDEFEGTVSLLHHVRDAQNYDFLAVTHQEVRQGRMSDGSVTTFAESPIETSGWNTLRAVGDGTHFRGYLGNELVVHGHGSAADRGVVGIRVEGRGTVALRGLSVQAI